MDFEYSARTRELQKKLIAFMEEHIYPNEPKYTAHVKSDRRWQPVPVIEELKPRAKAA
ncbi:MAG: acyl-CoA dehydrogenase, partial [Burkholderiales bacterium]|nr:acyl-CoA dehydrogenase [Burkholderiales bacterium]